MFSKFICTLVFLGSVASYHISKKELEDFFVQEIRKLHHDTGTDFCTGKKDGNYADPDVCAGFIQCANDRTFKTPCPADLRYDTVTDACVEPKCSATGFCAGKVDGTYPHPTDCTKFKTCANGVAYDQPCPGGLHYNAETKQCDFTYKAGCDRTLLGCHVNGIWRKPGEKWITADCTGSCSCQGQHAYGCVSLCPPGMPNCNGVDPIEGKKHQVSWTPACYCKTYVCPN